MRQIKQIHTAIDAPIGDLITFRAMPTSSIDHLDPFLFLNHHGPQTYAPGNSGLPFGPHPHKGFETLTFILQGDLTHMDTGGGKSVIKEGGIQWMTAGKGLVHAEISSDEFMEKGGLVEVIQIWLNLPARLKNTEPGYIGLQKDKIPVVSADNGKVIIHLVSGTEGKTSGPVRSLTGLYMSHMEFKREGSHTTDVDPGYSILFYVVKGRVEVNGKVAAMHDLVEFENKGEKIDILAPEDSSVIFGYGEPFNEPIVAQGPFVMNNMAEIRQAYLDYQSGKMGSL